MADKKMDLVMRVRAEVNSALAGLKQVEGAINANWKAAEGAGHAAAMPFRALSNATGMLLAPVRYAVGAVSALGAAFGALETKSLLASAGDEKLTNRLETLYGSADKAKRKFAELEGISRVSWFTPDELVEATIVMDHYGLGGTKALRAVGGAAKAAGVGIAELALQMSALQARGLKRFGIEMDEKNDKTTFQYRDRMGKIVKVVAAGADEARKALLGIFETKFGGKIEARGFSGVAAAFRNVVDQAFANFGDGLLPHATAFVGALRAKLAGLIESGTIAKWGERAAEAIVHAFDYARAVFEKGKEIVENLNGKAFAEGWGPALKIVFTAAAETLVVAFVNYLGAASDTFIALGRMIGSAVLASIAGSDMPGAAVLRAKMTRQMAETAYATGGINALHAMSPEIAALSFQLHKPGMTREQAVGAAGEQASRKEKERLITADASSIFASALQALPDNLKKRWSETSGTTTEIWTKADRDLQRVAGIEHGETVPELMHKYQRRREGMVDAQAWYGMQSLAPSTAPVPETNYGAGGIWAGGRLAHAGAQAAISIQNVTVHSSDTRRMQNEIIRKATARRSR